MPSHFALEPKVILLEYQPGGVRERALALFAGRVRRALGFDHDVPIFITDNAEIRQMNRQYRQKDEVTDVLSFEPLVGKRGCGDVAVSAEIAATNAAELGHSTETELKILILHGLLHLAGYDHECDNGEMLARERELREQLKLPVGLIDRAHGANPMRTQATPRKAARRRRARGRRR